MDKFDIFKLTTYSNHMDALNNTHLCILTLHQLLVETGFGLTTLSTTEIDKHFFVNHHLTKE